ncbi:MAG: 1,2-phenylacetyl-CoA epoxidase subunit PaaB [Actinomycetota bacterium]
MTYDVPPLPGERFETGSGAAGGYPLWEVFVRQRRGLSHVHSGSLHAPDAETALQAARDVYTRRQEGVSIWVVPSSQVHAFEPEAALDYYDASEKAYRHATHYDIPDEVGQM